ncbi:hypothetical protein DFS34DRAFT_390265 [Phlyctochytrium arcticum]|nr:hypothetical protein DFS34DRAFT_390265 [Phlyctochytrium arcticum]
MAIAIRRNPDFRKYAIVFLQVLVLSFCTIPNALALRRLCPRFCERNSAPRFSRSRFYYLRILKHRIFLIISSVQNRRTSNYSVVSYRRGSSRTRIITLLLYGKKGNLPGGVSKNQL